MTLFTSSKFKDLDQQAAYEECYKALYNHKTQNFVIEFDDENANVAIDLDANSLGDFLNFKRPNASTTRWINIFSPEKQAEHIARIAIKYGLSPRLHGIIKSKHFTPKRSAVDGPSVPRPSWSARSPLNTKLFFSGVVDPEKASDQSLESLDPPALDVNHYTIVDQVWHFCSIDWSQEALCIGFNSLPNLSVNKSADLYKDPSRNKFKRKLRDSQQANTLGDNRNSKPGGHRVWTWLLLCGDDTVISIHEDPFPSHEQGLSPEDEKTLKVVRRNLCNVFKQLSRLNENKRRERPIETLDIRPGLLTFEGSSVTIADSAGLLFHYLFDDWYTTYALVARQGDQYANVLDILVKGYVVARTKMFNRAQLERVEQLHQTGRQLAVLKRMYQSYVLIIDQILNRQGRSKLQQAPDGTGQGGGQMVEQDNEAFKAPLTPKAAVKFERLRDRIKLYALSEIEECLQEKETLTFLNFNLITMRQSEAVEKLTRITILLAKVTILFMPVSLMTGYFSVQIEDLTGVYTARTYWVCFAVIMSLSFFFLLVFGVISHTLEGGMIYKSITKATLDIARAPSTLLRGQKQHNG
ncbi:uncharacterized protein KY384_002174 [Bacidia gigantensis]|uniref:uncharacterized protein n=1 Tax=Bacidia gigantensis TaxID=2732470 RepID=UPI001D051D4D|nr:uncharacterized protein KY384_002174 [Bacidia gigantensis]KAG8533391.1 hypothetical protein KY384_002174 [Bacidia gigantensis]